MPPSLLPQNTWMSRSPVPSGRPRQLGGLGSGLPYFVDAEGNRITSVECGQPYDFRVDGFAKVYLIQTKDGAPQFEGYVNIPMGYWEASCTQDPGVYHGSVYDPFLGLLLGEYDFTVLPAPGGSAIGGLSGMALIAVAGLALLLMHRR